MQQLKNLFSFPALGMKKVVVWYLMDTEETQAIKYISFAKELASPNSAAEGNMMDWYKPVVEYYADAENPLELCETTFNNMQGEVFSPNGEARELIASLDGVHHTSMSVGDMVQVDGDFYFCSAFGFHRILFDGAIAHG